MKQCFQKTNKVVTGKTPFLVTDRFCGHHSVCLNIGFLASDMAVLYGNVFTILALLTKKLFSSFSKTVFVFQKFCLKVLQTFKIFTDCHIKKHVENP